MGNLDNERVAVTGRNSGICQLMQGNRAIAEGAIYAGARFYAGYPITPSSEIADEFAMPMPKVGGMFIQMEDEIGSIAAVIGAFSGGRQGVYRDQRSW